MATVKIIKEVTNGVTNTWRLTFQWCEYQYDDGTTQMGYRYIWRRPDNSLQAARGQARLPSLQDISELMNLAAYEGWLGSIE